MKHVEILNFPKKIHLRRATTSEISYVKAIWHSSLEANNVLSQSRHSPHFVEPEGSLPHREAPATCPYSEPRCHCLPSYHTVSPAPRTCERFRSLVSFYGEELLSRGPTPSWRTAPCLLSVTVYSIYSQLSIISGGRSSIRRFC